MDYVNLPVEVEPDALEQRAYDYLAERMDGWKPAPGNLDTWIIEAFAQIAADIASEASDVPVAIFRYLGTNLVQIPPREATSATGLTTWTTTRTTGLTVPAGRTIAASTPDGLVAFQTLQDFTLAPGETTRSGVPVVAVVEGASGSNLGGQAIPLDALDGVASVTFDAPTSGGQDAETDDEYLPRLVEELTLLSPRAITGNDAAILVKRVSGVERAVVLDGYEDGTTGVPGVATVILMAADGSNVTQAAKAEATDLLTAEDKRLLNLVFHLADPTRTPIRVDFIVTVWPDFDPDATVENAKAAVAAYLSPANWGQPNYGDRRAWVETTTVRYLEVAQAINEVAGVNYIVDLQVNTGRVDVSIPGPGAVPVVPANGITGRAV